MDTEKCKNNKVVPDRKKNFHKSFQRQVFGVSHITSKVQHILLSLLILVTVRRTEQRMGWSPSKLD